LFAVTFEGLAVELAWNAISSMVNIIPIFLYLRDFVSIRYVWSVWGGGVRLVHESVPSVEQPPHGKEKACLPVIVAGDFDNAVSDSKVLPFRWQHETMIAICLL